MPLEDPGSCETTANSMNLRPPPPFQTYPNDFEHIQDIVNQANYISVSESSEKTDEAKISQKSLETAFERALYNFNKFLAERPHVKLERGSDSSEVIQSNSKSTTDNSFFV